MGFVDPRLISCCFQLLYRLQRVDELSTFSRSSLLDAGKFPLWLYSSAGGVSRFFFRCGGDG